MSHFDGPPRFCHILVHSCTPNSCIRIQTELLTFHSRSTAFHVFVFECRTLSILCITSFTDDSSGAAQTSALPTGHSHRTTVAGNDTHNGFYPNASSSAGRLTEETLARHTTSHQSNTSQDNDARRIGGIQEAGHSLGFEVPKQWLEREPQDVNSWVAGQCCWYPKDDK
jgi:hypothetical protein